MRFTFQTPAQCARRSRHERFCGGHGTLQHVSRLLLGQIQVEAENKCRPLTMRQCLQSLAHYLSLLNLWSNCDLDGGRARLSCHVVPLRPHLAKTVTRQIYDRPAQVGFKCVRALALLKSTKEADKRILSDVFCSMLITRQQKREANGLTGVSPVELGERLLTSPDHSLPQARRAHLPITLHRRARWRESSGIDDCLPAAGSRTG